MTYVEEHLLPNEQIVHRAYLHKIVYIVPVVAAIVLMMLAVVSFRNDVPAAGIAALVLALGPLIYAHILYTSSEFAVTDRRVVIKVGFIQRRTLETLLGKVEAIEVNQGVLGRMLGYGTIVVTGTGGTREMFQNIAAPLEFRRQVQAQVTSGEPAAAGVAGPRDERDCPFCAERILTRAKVCKHCGRDVEAVTR